MLLPPDKTMALKRGRAHVDVGGLDGVEEELGDARLVAVDQVRLEQALGPRTASEPNADHPPVGQRVALDQHRRVLA